MVRREFKPHVPQSLAELVDQLGFMMLSSPTFVDKTGYLPEQNLQTTFFELNEGLNTLRGKLGRDLYGKLSQMSDEMRAYFEADPEDKGSALKGRELILKMEDLVRAAAGKS